MQQTSLPGIQTWTPGISSRVLYRSELSGDRTCQTVTIFVTDIECWLDWDHKLFEPCFTGAL